MTTDGRMRIDLWLFRVRLFKTRAAAAAAITAQGIRIERDGQVRRTEKPSIEIAPGDMVSLNAPGGPAVFRVAGLPHRRGPAPEARACYESLGAGEPDGEEGEQE